MRRTLLWLSMICCTSCSCRQTASAPDGGSPASGSSQTRASPPAAVPQPNEQDPSVCPPPVGATPDERLESYLACAGRKDARMVLLEQDSFLWLGGVPSDGGLRRLRNAYFARAGLRFASVDLKDWFSRFAWYVPQHDRADRILSRADQRRVEWISQVERAQPEFGRRSWAVDITRDDPSNDDITTLCPDGRAFRTWTPSEDRDPLHWGRWRRTANDVFVIRWTRSTGGRGVEGTQYGCASTCSYAEYVPFDVEFDLTTRVSVEGDDEGHDAEHTHIVGLKAFPEVCHAEKTSGWVGTEPTMEP